MDLSNENIRILAIIPGKQARGGITNYYYTLKNEFNLSIDYLIRGSRTWPIRKSLLHEVIRAAIDVWKFFIIALKGKYNLVQTSTSFDGFSVIRDGIYILIAKAFRINTVVFFHGWHNDFELQIDKKYNILFKFVFFKVDSIIVLSNKFRNKLISWGYKKNIYVETTVVEKELVDDISEEFIYNKYENFKNPNILFLARIETYKGIYEALDAFLLIKNKIPNITMTIAGDGLETENIKLYIKKNKIKNVLLVGHQNLNGKKKSYKNGLIYIFPSYSEGMPTTVLEAMACGLPIITRSVGGLVDFFKNGINGFMTESKDPKIFAELIIKLLEDKTLMQKIAYNNFKYAGNNFLSSAVVKRIEKIYSSNIDLT